MNHLLSILLFSTARTASLSIRRYESLTHSLIIDCFLGFDQSEARHTIQESLQTLNLGRTECAVRINSMDSGFANEDLKVIFSGKKTPQTILLPKVETKEDLDSVIRLQIHF